MSVLTLVHPSYTFFVIKPSDLGASATIQSAHDSTTWNTESNVFPFGPWPGCSKADICNSDTDKVYCSDQLVRPKRCQPCL